MMMMMMSPALFTTNCVGLALPHDISDRPLYTSSRQTFPMAGPRTGLSRRAQSGHSPTSGLSTGLAPPSRQKLLHGLMGIAIGRFIVHIMLTYVHVGLLNLLSPDTFSGVKMVKNTLTAGAVPRTQLEVYSVPQTS